MSVALEGPLTEFAGNGNDWFDVVKWFVTNFTDRIDEGPISGETTERAIMALLAKASPAAISDALEKMYRHGGLRFLPTDFTRRAIDYHGLVKLSSREKAFNDISYRDYTASQKFTAERLEDDYILAEKTGNTAKMNQIAEQFKSTFGKPFVPRPKASPEDQMEKDRDRIEEIQRSMTWTRARVTSFRSRRTVR